MSHLQPRSSPCPRSHVPFKACRVWSLPISVLSAPSFRGFCPEPWSSPSPPFPPAHSELSVSRNPLGSRLKAHPQSDHFSQPLRPPSHGITSVFLTDLLHPWDTFLHTDRLLKSKPVYVSLLLKALSDSLDSGQKPESSGPSATWPLTVLSAPWSPHSSHTGCPGTTPSLLLLLGLTCAIPQSPVTTWLVPSVPSGLCACHPIALIAL